MSAVPRSDIREIRRAWKEANLAPLWENARAHRPPPLPEAAYLWSWDKIRPLISAAIDVASPEVVERRVLQLVPPIAKHQDEQQTSSTLSANIQILLPGEKARPHRHTMNALRFVLEGLGARTRVDGRPCPMEEGALILTPSWSWHEHIHQGDAPIVWLDALDVPFQRYMGTGAVEPGPVADMPETVADAAFAVANVVPDTNYATKDYSPSDGRGGGRRRSVRARRLAARALRQSAHRRLGDGDDGLLPGAARSRRGHAALPHHGELGVLRGGRLRRKPGRRRHHPMEQARHLHVAAGQPHRSQERRRDSAPVPGVRPRHVRPARAA